MKRWALLCMAFLLSLCLLCGCGEIEPQPLADGETYLEGLWYMEEEGLHVGYSFFSDGGGFLFIGETVVPIRYGISGDSLYVSDNGNVETLPFFASEEGLWIDGMLFRPVEEDPEVSAAVESMRQEAMRSEAMRSEAQQSTDSSDASQTGKFVVQLITLAAAAGVVVILIRFLRNRKKS